MVASIVQVGFRASVNVARVMPFLFKVLHAGVRCIAVVGGEYYDGIVGDA